MTITAISSYDGTVSVPLRGIGSEKPQWKEQILERWKKLEVSVPLRGIGSEKPN